MCVLLGGCFFFFKQKTAYEILRSDWSSDVCSSDLNRFIHGLRSCNRHKPKGWNAFKTIYGRNTLGCVRCFPIAVLADCPTRRRILYGPAFFLQPPPGRLSPLRRPGCKTQMRPRCPDC